MTRHSHANAATILNMAVDYLHACNAFGEGVGSESECAECLADLASFARGVCGEDEEGLGEGDWLQ